MMPVRAAATPAATCSGGGVKPRAHCAPPRPTAAALFGAGSRGNGAGERRVLVRASSDAGPPEDRPAPRAPEAVDWREFRSRLVAGEATPAAAAPPESESAPGRLPRWAHALEFIETGCLLLASPAVDFGRQAYFHRSAIFLFDHSAAGGSAGLILNKPSVKTIADVPELLTRLGPAFGSSPLGMGGDVGRDSLHVIHGLESLDGSTAIMPGVSYGGASSVPAAVRAGEDPSRFRWHVGYCGWGPGQLESELESGVWHLAAASPGLVLQPPERPEALWEEALRLSGRRA